MRALSLVGVVAILSVTLLGGSASADDDPLPLEALVAIVGGETPEDGTDLVLLSDVELRAQLDLGPAGAGVSPSRALLAATLNEIIGELLIEREAARLHATEPSDAEVRVQRLRLVTALGGEPSLATMLAQAHAADEEIDLIARRRAFVDAFLRANLEGSTTISDARVEEAFALHEHPFSGLTLDAAREPLRAWLALRSLADDVARWVTVLRQRTTVRVLVALSPRISDVDDPTPVTTPARPEEQTSDVPR